MPLVNFVEDVMSLAPTDSNFCHQFPDYILETYISSTAKFRPEMWSDVPCAELKRTTNGLEFFHSHFSQQFYSAHPICIGPVKSLSSHDHSFVCLQEGPGF
jgi:hypothetical protein